MSEMIKPVNSKRQRLAADQTGLVSFIVVIIIMFILSVIVLAFAKLVRREQIQTLDRQLNSQALYAAESGVNDAQSAILKAIADNKPIEKSDCKTDSSSPEPFGGLNPDLGNGVSYSCLLVSTALDELVYDDVNTSDSKIAHLQYDNGDIGNFTIEWRGKDVSSGVYSGCPGIREFPSVWPDDCDAGILRIDLVPLGSVTRGDLNRDAKTVFLQPRNDGTNSSSILTMGQGDVIDVKCQDKEPCSLQLSGLGASKYALRMKSIYKSNTVNIIRVGNKKFIGEQALIDVTGRASGVLRRIQVRAKISSFADIPADFAIRTNITLCKNFGVTDNTIVENADGNSFGSGSACDTQEITR